MPATLPAVAADNPKAVPTPGIAIVKAIAPAIAPMAFNGLDTPRSCQMLNAAIVNHHLLT